MAAPASDTAQATLVIVESVQRFKATITPEHKAQIECTAVKDVVDAILVIQQNLVNRRANRNLRKLYPFVQGLGQYSSALDVLSNGLSPYLPFIWAPIKLMLQIASDYLDAFDKLIDAYDRIAETLPRISQIGQAFKDSPTLLSKLSLYYADILEFHRRAYKFLTRKSWRFFFMTTWASFDVRFGSILTNMARTRDVIDREAITMDIVQSKKWREDMDIQVSLKEKDRLQDQRASIIAWLGIEPLSQGSYCEQLLRDCLPESCDWVPKHPKLIPWLQTGSKTPVVWVHGKPGAGKTTICANLIEYLQETGMNTIYYFCRYHQSDTSSKILKALVLKLIDNNPDIIPVAYADYIEKYREPTLKVLKRMLAGTDDVPGLLSGASPCRIIVDGVDECEPKEQRYIIEDLLQLVSVDTTPTKHCKLLVSSRNLPDIARALQKKVKAASAIQLSEEKDSMNHTIESLARARLSDMAIEKPSFALSDTTIAELCHVIVDKADGMMLWVKLVLETLSDIDTPRELHEAITSMPQELSELYTRILTFLCHQKAKKVADRIIRILGWLAYTKRPLKKHELLRGVALTPESPVLDRWDTLDDSAIDRCKPLIEQLPDGSITLIHFTTEEFLREHCKLDPITQQPFTRAIAFSCTLALRDGLSLLDQDISEEDRLLTVLNGSQALLVYAIDFWLDHLLDYNTGDSISPHSPIGVVLTELGQRHQNLWSKVKHKTQWTGGQYHTPETDSRLEAISTIPVRSLCGSLISFKASLGTKEVANGEEFEKASVDEDPTLFTSLSTYYNSCVIRLLEGRQVDNMPAEQLARFKEQYSQCLYRCRFPPCTNTCFGFASEALRIAHEKLHVKRLFCVHPKCPRGKLGFRSQRDLEAHTKMYHDEGGILVPPRVRTTPSHIDRRIHFEEYPATNSVKRSPTLSKRVHYPKSNKLALHFGETMTDEIRGYLEYDFNGDSVIMLNKNQEPRNVDVDHVLTVNYERSTMVFALDISPDDTLIAVGLRECVEILDLNSGEALYRFEEGGQVDFKSVCFSPDGQLVAFIDRTSYDLRVWDYTSTIEQKVRIGRGHTDTIRALSYAPNGQFIATASDDRTIRLWSEAQDATIMTTISKWTQPTSIAILRLSFTPDSRHIVGASNIVAGSCVFFDAQTGALEHQIAHHNGGCIGVAVSKNGQFLATASFDSTANLYKRCGDEDEGLWESDPIVLRYHKGPVNGITFSPDRHGLGGLVFTASLDYSVICWDVGTGQPLAILAGHRSTLYAVAAGHTQPYIVTAYSSRICIWRYEKRANGIAADPSPVN